MKYIKGNADLDAKQVKIMVGWLVFMGLINWYATDSFLHAVQVACLGGVLGLGAIFISERYLN